jgi:hypothetical protein
LLPGRISKTVITFDKYLFTLHLHVCVFSATAVPPSIAAPLSQRNTLRRRTSITGARVIGSTTAQLAEAVWMHPLPSVRI